MTKTLIFDTETTGKNDPILIEAAWIEVLDIPSFQLGASFCERFNPGKPI